jgi:anti-sigma factor RsiW
MAMRCNNTRELIGAYVDDELDLVRSLDIEGHLHECSICSREYQNHRSLRRAIKGAELNFEAPPGLEKRIRTNLGRANKSEAKPWSLSWRWAIAGASVAATVAMLLFAAMTLNRHQTGDLLAQDVVSSHLRSLIPGHTIDVPSTDQHTVKPWFNGKLDFSPPVRDLADKGFNLTGGRLDYVDNRPVAVVVYTRRLHTINLYIWLSNTDANAGGEATVRQGYNMIHWTKEGMIFWAVSDLNTGELHDFVKAQRE